MSDTRSVYERVLARTLDETPGRGLELAREAAATELGDARIASLVAFLEWQTRTIDVPSAIERLRTLHAADPSEPEITGDLSVVLFSTGERHEGERLLHETVAAHPEHARSWRRLAWMQAVMLRYPRSWEYYRTSIELEPLASFVQRAIAYRVARKAHDRAGGARLILGTVDRTQRVRIRVAGLLNRPVLTALTMLSMGLVAAGVAIRWPFAVLGVAVGAVQLLGVDRSALRRMTVWLAYVWIVTAVTVIVMQEDSGVWTALLFAVVGGGLILLRASNRRAPPMVVQAGRADPDPATKLTRLALLGGPVITTGLVFAPWYRQCVWDLFCAKGAGVPGSVVTLAFGIACANFVWSILRFAEPRPRFSYERRAMVSCTLSAMSAAVSAVWLFVPETGTDATDLIAALIPGLERTPWGWVCLAVTIVVATVAIADLRGATAASARGSERTDGSSVAHSR